MQREVKEVMGESVQERLSTIHYILKELFPEAVSVSLFLNSEGIDVTPCYKTDVSGYNMRTITGNWIKKVD